LLKAGHSASIILGSIMPTKMLIWHLIKEERYDYSNIGGYCIIVHVTRKVNAK
jgi:hypothetical protein